ncbi:hypothetical protein ACIQJ4_06250 [Streptomyces filamentosus]|uniref:hypothetical protein n=1 Tax=Streptomyces filamentosus TaxID=67294 RepID=UPI0038075BD8
MEKRYIEQFIWGYQEHFRGSLDTQLERVLKSIGFDHEAQSFLIGFQVSGSSPFPICLEQGEQLYCPEDFSHVQGLADEKYETHPERHVLHSHQIAHERFHKRLRDRMRAEAIESALIGLKGSEDSAFFVGNSVRVGDYEVHIVVSTDAEAVTAVPQISTTARDRMTVLPSLFHAVTWEVVNRASRELHMPDPGSMLDALNASAEEVVRSATETLLRTILYCTGYWFASDFHSLMNGLSALPYEGRPGSGRLVLAEAGNPSIKVSIKLTEPVQSRDTPAIRKLLEASGSEVDVLSDGEYVYGLGVITPAYDPQTESIFVVTFQGRGVWELSHAGVPLIAVRDGISSLPRHVLDENYLIDLCDRLFPDGESDALLRAARAIGRHRHGAMLVVSIDAENEARRLSPQSWAIDPAILPDDLLTQLTDMDGAVLLDPKGKCHAIGVILDGIAKGKGDPARGSRMNNAVRYLGSAPPPAIVVVYSADGGIDILPRLHPRVSKDAVECVVSEYLEIASQRPPALRRIHRAWKRVEPYEFYLSDKQCEALNRARKDVQAWRMQNNHLCIEEPALKPHPEMSDDYWLPTTPATP